MSRSTRRNGFVALLALTVVVFILWRRKTDTLANDSAPAATTTAGPQQRIVPSAPAGRVQRIQVPKENLDAGIASSAVGGADGGVGSLFGPLVAIGQGQAFADALQKNAANADAYVDTLCSEGNKLRTQSPIRPPRNRERDAAQFMAPLVDY